MIKDLLDYKDLFDYLRKARVKMIEALERLPSEELSRDRGISFGSIKNVFVHTVIAEDNWLHHIAVGESWSRLRAEDFTSLDEIKEFIKRVDAKTDKLLSETTEQDLQREIRIVGTNEMEQSYELGDILYQVPIQAIYHFGEILAEFWMMNLEAPYYSYLTSYAPTRRAHVE